ncbi:MULTISPECIES: EamA family transporter [Brevibacillus]|jgi:Permeases of the drug/metabolite transporter (DMT) superfamily|uniref:Drug/metabolite exporter YedA n=1 Tax=Brevibacillus parabrevis TaxID=54914 RepID=A0A4Y3PHI5_BREPA|nr:MULTISPECIES: EamA family transporter [Brevibacillus]MDH6348326.1 drug/metabolite transporter (DMT)-like permease [Brevibacillus sp. 1238]MDR5000466.1 EamA family transporter [Brevibacillus parabrevis]UED70403.1 EamA family transporter [Brevibacillus sp. HD3.3A]GEB30678.1 drug/metabolite exporter YedA [Brevibacillus parabrevis]
MMQGKKAMQIGESENSNITLVVIALLSVYIFWGGTYLGMKVAIETIPPFIMAGIRFFVAGTVLYVLARLKGEQHPSVAEWKGARIVGALLLLGGNGLVAWAEQKVPSAIASLLVATVPLWILAFNWLGGNKKRPALGVLAGVLLGFSGIAVLVLNTGGANSQSMDTIGMIALLIASVSWSIGSLYSRRAKLPASPLQSTAAQMMVGGALLIFVSFFLDDWTKLHLSELSVRSALALGYLIVFGSIISYTAYIWLLKNADPAWVSTYAFVNPIVAVFLGGFSQTSDSLPTPGPPLSLSLSRS